jgi:hypothetical protein
LTRLLTTCVPEFITIGTNELIGTDPRKLPPALARLMAGQGEKGAIPPKWDGKAGKRIVAPCSRKAGVEDTRPFTAIKRKGSGLCVGGRT